MIVQDKFFSDDNYKHLRLSMKIVGIWPYRSFTSNFIFLIISVTIAFSILIPEIAKIVEDIDDLDKVFDSLPTILVAIFCGQLLIGTSFGVNNLRKCLDKVMQDWSTFVADTEIQILSRYTQLSNKLGIGYFVFMSFTAFVFLLQPLLHRIIPRGMNTTVNPADTVPYRLQYGVNIETYYIPIFLHCCIALYTHIIIFSALNFIYTACIQHACAIFFIIGHRLENFCKNSNNIIIDTNNIQKVDDKHYYDVLDCLRLHIKAMEFCGFLENTFTITYLFSLGINMILLTLSGIQTMMHLDDIQRALRYIFLYLAILCQLFWQSWQAQLLMDSSTIPYESIFRSQWYQASTRCKRLLLLILIRGAIPSKLTAGKICTLSIETFSAVLRTSMSYFTVLRSVQ